jgi:hypothetical protein
MLTRYVKIIGLIAALSVFSGCGTFSSQKETMLDRNWGTSLKAVKQSQILNPEAGKTPYPVAGLDGWVAEANMMKYRGMGITEDVKEVKEVKSDLYIGDLYIPPSKIPKNPSTMFILP